MNETNTKSEQRNCRTHGEYEARMFRFKVDGNWLGGECPQCVDEESKRREKASAEEAKRNKLEGRLRSCRIPKRFENSTFDNYKPKTNEAEHVVKTLRRYVDTWPARFDKGCSLILSGNVGTGKTHLACATGLALISKYLVRTTYATVAEIMREIRATYSKSDATEDSVLKVYASVPLLILDEVGVQSGSDHEHTMLFEVINRRYAEMLPTIVITNLGVRDLENAIGERLVDRLREDGAVLTFTWESYRGAA